MHVHNHILYVSHNTHLSQVSKSPHVSRKLKNIMVDAPLSHICFPSLYISKQNQSKPKQIKGKYNRFSKTVKIYII